MPSVAEESTLEGEYDVGDKGRRLHRTRDMATLPPLVSVFGQRARGWDTCTSIFDIPRAIQRGIWLRGRWYISRTHLDVVLWPRRVVGGEGGLRAVRRGLEPRHDSAFQSASTEYVESAYVDLNEVSSAVRWRSEP